MRSFAGDVYPHLQHDEPKPSPSGRKPSLADAVYPHLKAPPPPRRSWPSKEFLVRSLKETAEEIRRMKR
jgi:hypothetical protein